MAKPSIGQVAKKSYKIVSKNLPSGTKLHGSVGSIALGKKGSAKKKAVARLREEMNKDKKSSGYGKQAFEAYRKNFYKIK